MELTYSLTTDDFWQFNKLVLRKNPTQLLRLAVSAVLVPVLLFFELWIARVIPTFTGFVIWLVLSIFWAVFLAWNFKRMSLRRVQQPLGGLGLRMVRIDSAALVSSSELIQTRFLWRAVTNISDSPVGVLLFVTKVQAIIIPNSAFTSAGQRESFVQMVTAYWRHAVYGDPLPEIPALASDTSIWPPPPSTQLQA